MKLLLLLSQLLSVLTLIPWAIMAMFSPMLFDAPDSTKQMMPYIMIGLLLLYPFVIILCIVMGWRYWKKQHTTRAFLVSLLPAMLFITLFALLGS